MFVLTIDTATSYVISGLVEVTRREVTVEHDRRFASVAADNPVYDYATAVRAEKIVHSPRGHMELLTPNIAALLEETGVQPADIHAVVVGTGPGPFTGLRVGMATGAAFADAIGVPVFGVDSLAAAAAGLAEGGSAVNTVQDLATRSVEDPVLVISDARRREWYSALVGRDGKVIDGPNVTAPAEVFTAHQRATVALTDAVAAKLDKGELDVPAEWDIISRDAFPTPAGMATVAADRLWWLDGEGHFVEKITQPLEAQYLRRPDAVPPKLKDRSTAVDFQAADDATDEPEGKLKTGVASGKETDEETIICEQITGGPGNNAASQDDLVDMVDIERALFSDESPWPLEGFIAELENKRNYYVALRAGEFRKLVGYAGIAMNGPTTDPEWEIHTVAIRSDYQGKGLARRLIDALLEPVQVVGGKVFLEVREDNEPAIGLYKSYGFELMGRRKGYYQPVGADALTMVRPDEKGRGRDDASNKARGAGTSGVTASGDATVTGEAAPMLVMGVESSCDETGVGVVALDKQTGNVEELVNQVASSMEQHARFGGVVPEIASRAHLEAMQPTMRAGIRTLQKTQGIGQLPDAVAVTIGPGLAGALMVGAAAAKAYALAWGVPFYAVNHLGGHVAAETLEVPKNPAEHAIALLVSGGHTQLLEINGIGRPMKELGSTLDDAAGEAYDKVARLLGLGYPGGPVIDRLAKQGNKKAIAFPRGMMRPKDSRYDFSFSGLKTAVARYVERAETQGLTGDNAVPIEDVCASFQEAVVDVLTAKAIRACEDTEAPILLLGGGVSANSRLRELAADRCRAAGVELRIPRLPLCTDNGVMIAALAAKLIAEGAKPSVLAVATDPALDVETPLVAQ